MRWFGKKKEEVKADTQEDPTICDGCGSKRTLTTHEGFSLLVCLECKKNYEIVEPITKTYQIFIGKTLTNVDKNGFVRMHVEYPAEKRGEQIVRIKQGQYYPSVHDYKKIDRPIMKHGDKLAFACDGLDEHGIPLAIYYHNLTMGTVKSALIDDMVNLGKKFVFYNGPVVIYAEIALSKAVADYQSKMSELSVRIQETTVAKGAELEEIVMQLFQKMGFEDVHITGGASDKGIDLECFQKEGNEERPIVVQCKNQSLLNKIKPTQIRDFAHVLEREREKRPSTMGYFITSSYFSPECYIEENCGKDMELIDRDHLEKLLQRYGMNLDLIEKV